LLNIPKVILLIENSRSHGRGILQGITRYSRLHGPWAFYNEAGEHEKALPYLKKWGANGMIAHILNPKFDTNRIARDLPTIYIVDRGLIEGAPNIIGDYYATGEMAAKHFLDRGFRNFAYVGFSDMYWSNARAESFDNSIVTAGYKCLHYNSRLSSFVHSWERELSKLSEWLLLLPKPVGLMAANDDHGRHILEACKITGMRVPEDVAVLGVDNDELVCNLSHPPLSSIALGTEKAGYEAAELLHRMMDGDKPGDAKIIVSPLYVVTRQSTDMIAVEDEDVSNALRYIRQNKLNNPIDVNDVVRATMTSRRSLERKFKKIVGRSIHSEIKRVRIAQIEMLLLETDFSITQIAMKMEFSSVEQMARYYREETSISPREFRRQMGAL
jgi:LacI family transcriptional regulator